MTRDRGRWVTLVLAAATLVMLAVMAGVVVREHGTTGAGLLTLGAYIGAALRGLWRVVRK